jgi:hypothetical protein
MNKPDIIGVIGQRVDLRRAGKEYLGLCPLHDDRHPSLSVSEEKQVFCCFGCGASGDVIDFIIKLDGVTFAEAVKSLGVEGYRSERRIVTRTAVAMASWANTQTARANFLLREIGQRLQLADELGWKEESEISHRQWEILETLAEDLQTAKLVIELYANRAEIDALLADGELERDEIEFPPISDEYRERLRRIVTLED